MLIHLRNNSQNVFLIGMYNDGVFAGSILSNYNFNMCLSKIIGIGTSCIYTVHIIERRSFIINNG